MENLIDEYSTNIRLSQILLAPSDDFSQFKHLCFIDSTVESAYNFSSFLNDTTYPVIYSYDSDRESLKISLLTQFQQIDRVSFAFHGPPDESSIFTPKQFIHNEPFFSPDSTDNLQFLQDLFVSLNVQHADFLACNLLQQQEWKDYFVSFENIVIGASDDATGNLKYGGDWMMENTMEDVRDIYFQPSIVNFAGLLITFSFNDFVNNVYTGYTTSSSTAFITDISYSGVVSTYEYIIPNSVIYNSITYSVTKINANVIKDTTSKITKITIPNTCVTIAQSAFDASNNINNTSNLSSVSFSTGTQSLVSIFNTAFRNCSRLTSITFPTTVTTIGTYAFQNCTSLAAITIPSLVSSIGIGAFSSCTNLADIVFSGEVSAGVVSGSFPFINRGLSYTNTTSSKTNLFTAGLIRKVVSFTSTTNTYKYNGQGTLGTGTLTLTLSTAFLDFSNTALTIENGSCTPFLTADSGLNWTSTFTPTNNIIAATNTISLSTSYLSSVSLNAVSLNYTIYTLLPTLAQITFTSGTFVTVTLPSDLTSWSYTVNTATSWTEIILSGSYSTNASFPLVNGTTYSANQIQVFCTNTSGNSTIQKNLAQITAPNSYSDVPNNSVISFIALTSTTAEITGGNSTISSSTNFSLVIPSTVSIGADVYSVVSIGNNSFSNPPPSYNVRVYLQNVTLPSTVIKIGVDAFRNTPNLKINLDYIETYNAESFAGCKSFHNSSTGILTIYGRTQTLGSGALNSCNFTSVVFENNGYNNSLSIGDNCFWSDTLLTTVTIQPRSSISFGASSFYGCSLLRTVILPNGVTNIPIDTFYLCTSLTEVYLYCSAIPVIQAGAFHVTTTPKIYYLEGATSTTNLPTNKQMLIKIEYYNFYVKDTNTEISSPILFNNNAVDFKIIFVYKQSSFNSNDDITVNNGSLSLMTSSDAGFTYKGTFTPTSNTVSTTNNLNITANKYAVQDTIFGWAKSSSLISYSMKTTLPILAAISFPSGDLSYTPVINVTLPSDIVSWSYTENSGGTWTKTSLSAGYNTSTSFTLVNGTTIAGTSNKKYDPNQVQVFCTDAAGNNSTTQQNSSEIRIDTTAPSLAAISFPSGDLSYTPVINVTLPSDIVSWSYTENSGGTWTKTSLSAGYNTSTSFTLVNGTTIAGTSNKKYDPNQVQVFCTDAAGNNSTTQQNSSEIRIDTTAPSLAAISFPSGDLSYTPVINVTLPSDIVSWSYTENSGGTWTKNSLLSGYNTSTSFTLVNGTTITGTSNKKYVQNQVRVFCTDAAGNNSTTQQNSSEIRVDLTAPILAAVTFPSGDLSYNDVIINVTLPSDIVSWSYTDNSGGTWTKTSLSAGYNTSTSFTLVNGTTITGTSNKKYVQNQVRVFCTDAAGNNSTTQQNSSEIRVDLTAPILAAVTFPSGDISDNLVHFMNIMLPTDAVSWRYSVSSGVYWTSKTTSDLTFVLSDGTYDVNSIQVYCTDLAGNNSIIQKNSLAFNVFTIVVTTLPSLPGMHGIPVPSNINNRILSGTSAMPQKSSTSSNENQFSMNRSLFAKTIKTYNSQTVDTAKGKKFYGGGGNRDASSVMQRRKIFNVGEKNHSGGNISYQGTNSQINVTQAQQRVRNSGYVPPQKK